MKTMDKILIKAEGVVITKRQLKRNWDNDIYCYFDSEWSNANWMQVGSDYVILDATTGKVFYLHIK